MNYEKPYWNWACEPAVRAVIALAIALAGGGACLASGHSAASHDEAEADVESDDALVAKTRGIEIGEFRIRAYYPVQAQKSMVRFVLFIAVPGERYADTKRLVHNRRHKIRDQVITATRLVPLLDFDQSDLASFRRRILLRLRRTLPELKIDDVFVGNFELKVQSL
ncbi:MAG TPA: hypothetical protein VGK58_05525 [Lacipirellulaceae bacterium]